ncbi:SMC family ATPase [Thermus sp.]|uniref:SMC family ATPase n=1 Tax=Thermus sp. TaxID=275 RepID=UPI00321FF5DD
MRPWKLELEGFGPYRDKQEVDFSEVELFAITGPTGSGKSTLLDAIAFALYGRVPRVGRNVKDLVHPARSEARVRLTFAVGERLYRVERVRGKKSEARLFELGTVERLLPLETLEDVNRALEGLLGLSYEAFTRALLLPQGEFDRFLKGEAKERRQLLMDLFELSRLERAKEKAVHERDRLKGERDRLEGELSSLAGATQEALEALEGELEVLRQEEDRLQRERKERKRALEEAEALLEKIREKSQLEARRARLEAESEEIETLRRRLARSEEAARALPLWERYRRWAEALRKTEEEIAKAERSLENLRAQVQALAFDPQALEEARERLRQDQELKGLEGLWKRVAPSFPGGPPRHPSPRLDPLALEALLEKEASLQASLQELRRLAEREEALKETLEALERLEEEGKAQREEVEGLRARLKGALAHRLAQVEAALAALEGEEGALREALEALREEERRLGLLAYHDLLRPGEPCPLCGGVVHRLPERPSPKDLEGERKRLSERLGEVERGRGALLAEKESLEERLGGVRPEPLPGDPKALEGKLKEAEERLAALREAYKEKRGQVQVLAEAVQDLRKRVEGLGPLEEVERRLSALQEEKASLAAGLYGYLEGKTGGLGVERYLRDLEAKVKDLEAKEKRLKDLEEALHRVQSALSGLRAQKETQAQALEEARASVQGLMPEEEAKALALSPGAKEALEKKVQAHEKEWAEVEINLRKLSHLPPLSLAEAEARVREFREGLRAVEERLQELGREMGAKEARVESLREDLRRKRDLEARLAEVGKEVALWEKLAWDLQGNNFPAYLLGFRQRHLVERADGLLSTLSGGRYRLRVQEDEYRVLDLWTEAERPVKTLSGGESFLASLALALALSEELSRGRLGALFLDEGFGTLDPEALEGVAGILEALPTRGRLVGIVTHVEALAERLPARLRVRKHPSGSRVEWV